MCYTVRVITVNDNIYFKIARREAFELPSPQEMIKI
jgi:hypothetical protein